MTDVQQAPAVCVQIQLCQRRLRQWILISLEAFPVEAEAQRLDFGSVQSVSRMDTAGKSQCGCDVKRRSLDGLTRQPAFHLMCDEQSMKFAGLQVARELRGEIKVVAVEENLRNR